MSKLEVHRVATRRHRKEFIDLPWRLYQDDPNWIPPLRQSLAELVGFRPHPFQAYSDIQTFLVRRQGHVVGRIAALVNHAHNERYDERRGFFGFFECEQDQQAAEGLFRAAQDWLLDQGMDQVRGPCNPSLNYEIGLLVDGFDTPPRFMMTYNPPYYADLLEGGGLTKTQDLFAFRGHVDMIRELDPKMLFVIEEATKRFDVKLRTLDRKRFLADVRMFLNIYNQSLVGTWGFVPMSDAEVEHLAQGLRHLIVPEMTSIAEIHGEPVGAMFGLLDYNPRIKQINGRLFPFGFLRLLWNRRQIQAVRLLSTNVVPKYQRWGIGLVLLSRILPEVLAWGIQEAEFSWVLESNHLSRSTLERGGAQRQKTYRLYDGPLPLPAKE